MKGLQKVLSSEQYGYVLKEYTYLGIIRVLELQKIVNSLLDERTFRLLFDGE
jgi:hypothetical protein